MGGVQTGRIKHQTGPVLIFKALYSNLFELSFNICYFPKQQALTWEGATSVLRSTLQNNSTVARFFVLDSYYSIITMFELVLVEPELIVRSAHAFVEAEADFEDQEKLGEAAMQFFYASKVF